MSAGVQETQQYGDSSKAAVWVLGEKPRPRPPTFNPNSCSRCFWC